jgi:glyoxylase-like metal-dependent hydrolase (beta-lactamase superfamily II)
MAGAHEVVPGVYRLGTDKVNWYLVEEDGKLTAVDAGLPGFAADLERDLAAIGFTISDIEAVALTHSDADHIGVAAHLQKAGARVLIHAEDDATLRKPGGSKGGDSNARNILPLLVRPGTWTLIWHMMRNGGAKPVAVEGAETYTGGQTLDVPGRPLAIHTPGHTPGHCALLFAGRGALFVGDALCTWNPVTGARGPSVMPRALNVSTAQAGESLSALEDVEAGALLPGHGEPWLEGPAAAVARARAGTSHA